MGIEALTQNQDGTTVVPTTDEDWDEWVSAGRTRNLLLQDPLLDWLILYGEKNGFKLDTELPDYNHRTDFTAFIFERGREFEAAVVDHLRRLTSFTTICSDHREVRDITKAQETFAAMDQGVPVIYQGVLRDAESRTYGIPDLLVRSDELDRLFPGTLTAEGIIQAADDLHDAKWHYRVVDIKFTTLHLLVGGELGNGDSGPALKAQLYIYNRALGRLQGYLPPVSYILGRGLELKQRGTVYRGTNCIERLGPVSQSSLLGKDRPLAQAVEESCDWIRRVRRDGGDWNVLPEPSVPELYPNMGHTEDFPFSIAKREIGQQLEELTLLWQVGVSKRRAAHALEIFRWRDPRCTPESVGIKGAVQQPILEKILAINRSDGGAHVAPERVTAEEDIWREEPALEFYVDFETVTSLDDDFSKIPEKGGQPLIFMIGCGHVEEGEWNFECYIVDTLTEECEERIIDEWLAHMKEVRLRLAPEIDRPLVIHWSPAEKSFIETAYNSAVERHPHKGGDWTTPTWFDFLKQVIKAQPVVVRGALGFGLKKVAQTMHKHELIETSWEDSSLDGLGAMVGAWWCASEAAEKSVRLIDVGLMQSIRRYNEVDCKVMMEIVTYLRQNH